MKIVLKELKESRVWMKIIRKKKYFQIAYIDILLNECEELVRITAKSRIEH